MLCWVYQIFLQCCWQVSYSKFWRSRQRWCERTVSLLSWIQYRATRVFYFIFYPFSFRHFCQDGHFDILLFFQVLFDFVGTHSSATEYFYIKEATSAVSIINIISGTLLNHYLISPLNIHVRWMDMEDVQVSKFLLAITLTIGLKVTAVFKPASAYCSLSVLLMIIKQQMGTFY